MTEVSIGKMVVEVDGAGEPLVMVHGLGGTSNYFTPHVELLHSRFKLYRPDLIGSGRSPSSGPLSIDGFVDDLMRLMDAFGLESAHFMGHSMGAIVCFHLASRFPHMVRSLALQGPLLAPADGARDGIRERARIAREQGMTPVADAVVQAATSGDTRRNQPAVVALVREILMRQMPEGYARTCEALAAVEAPDITPITCPTLLIGGDEDVVAPPRSVQAIAESIPGARQMVLSRCGHWTAFERPVEVNAALNEFYSRRG